MVVAWSFRSRKLRNAIYIALSFILFICTSSTSYAFDDYIFERSEWEFIRSFSIERLPSLTKAYSNRFADMEEAAIFGQTLFFDRNLSGNKRFSCAHCHQPNQAFTDGKPRGVAFAQVQRNTPSILGLAYSPWLYWDGRKDSLWSQALEPLESLAEQNISRAAITRYVLSRYGQPYQEIFGRVVPSDHNRDPMNSEEIASILSRIPLAASPIGNEAHQTNWQAMPEDDQKLVNLVFSNVGKAIMAYERRLIPTPSRFDQFISAIDEGRVNEAREIFSINEVKGLRLFMGQANCASCHNGPLFTNFEFHNIGAPEPDITRVDKGRATGVLKLKEDSFTCLSDYSDASRDHCLELIYLKSKGLELIGAFKTPSLRNIELTSPYMQSGQLSTLREVVAHYNKPKPPFYDPKQHKERPHFDIIPLALTPDESEQLVAFLKSLTSLTMSKWMKPPDDL